MAIDSEMMLSAQLQQDDAHCMLRPGRSQLRARALIVLALTGSARVAPAATTYRRLDRIAASTGAVRGPPRANAKLRDRLGGGGAIVSTRWLERYGLGVCCSGSSAAGEYVQGQPAYALARSVGRALAVIR